MTVPAHNVTAGHPRVFFRASEKTALTARTNDTSGWKTLWDGDITTDANNFKAQADSTLGATSNPHLRWMLLAFYGYIEETGRPVNGYKDKAIKAAIWLANANPPNPSNSYERYILIGLAAVFDICFDDMTTTEKNTLASEIIEIGNNMSNNPVERMHGWSGNDQTCALIGALAVHGYSTFATQAQALLTKALNFLWGTGTGADAGRLELARYQYTGGGAEKGGMYFQLGIWCELWALWVMSKGTDHDAWTAETAWAKKIWEWVLWTQYRGGASDDPEAHGDTNKASAPKFFVELRWLLAMLADRFPNPDGTQGGQQLRWLYDRYDSFDSPNGENAIYDVIFLDRATVTAVEPKNATTPAARQKLFSPPGIFFFRGAATADDSWDYDKAITYRESARRWYWLGHFHLDSGALQIVHKGDVLTQAPAGYYDLTQGSTGHYNNALLRSWTQSGVPLVFQSGETYHLYSTVSANDGGQQYRKYVDAVKTWSDPGDVFRMQNDGGGLAWLRCESFTKQDFVGAGSAASPEAVFTVANIRYGYKKLYTDGHKLPICEVKTLYIRPTAANGLTYPCVIRYYRIQKTDEDWVVTIPWHTYQAITTTAYGAHWTGYNSAASLSPAGKLWCDIRSVGSYTLTNATPGSLDTNGWGADQWKIPQGGSTNYKPLVAAKDRLKPDVKRHSLYVSQTTPTQEEHYVFQLATTDAADSQPATIGAAWISDVSQPDYYGKTIGTTTYLIHRTQALAVVGTPDTTAPAETTGLALAPRSAALLATWTDPADSDLAEIVVEYRTAAV